MTCEWPKWVWVGLTDQNFCKHNYVLHDCGNLLGWIEKTFAGKGPDVRDEVYNVVDDLAENRVDYEWFEKNTSTSERQAKIWNKAMAKLGYTEEYKG